ncbi:MAG: OFA family MFS transporter [Negativicutes bacterium]|nr:OFA family MFS transporter [Negativicutes bacterium]
MKNRWLIAVSAVGIHICIGSVYAWSVLTKPIMNELGLGLKETQWAFSLAILFLGLSAAFLGGWVEKCGPRKSGLFAAIFFCSGMFGTGLAVLFKSLPLLYLFYGVIGGIGLGTGYITPISTLVKCFPEKRGFATGIAIMGFGFSSLIAGPVIQVLLERYSLFAAFEILGLAYLLIMVPSALYLEPPQEIHEQIKTSGASCPITGVSQATAAEALKTWRFYALWWMLFTNITCGIGLLSVASPMAQEVIKLSPLAAATMVGIIGLVNGFGRFAWSSVSDYIGRPNTYLAFFVIQIFAFFLLSKTTDSLIFQLLIYLIISCYGGGFAAIPAFLSDLFGTRQLSAIHGNILTAWAAAGVVGPLLVAWVRETTNSYNDTLMIFSLCFIVSLVVAAFLKFRQAPAASAEDMAYARIHH